MDSKYETWPNIDEFEISEIESQTVGSVGYRTRLYIFDLCGLHELSGVMFSLRSVKGTTPIILYTYR